MKSRGWTDLGHGTSYTWYTNGWEGKRIGIIFRHQRPDGQLCVGSVPIESLSGNPTWRLVSEDPLELEPSILCKHEGCDTHGHIRGGRWIPC